MEDKRNRSEDQQGSNQPRERRRDRKSGGSMESPGDRPSPREDEEQPQE